MSARFSLCQVSWTFFLALWIGTSTEFRADILYLKDGSNLTGTLIAADLNTVVFQGPSGMVTRAKSECRAVVFGDMVLEPGALPAGISAAAPYRVVRWTGFRRITAFESRDMAPINNLKISADGSRIVFSTYGGTYTIHPDGTNLVRLSDKRSEGHCDISANGRRVVWYDGIHEGYVADADGGNRVKLPGGFGVISLRLTADGSRVIVLTPERGGIFYLNADGSDMRRIVGTAELAKCTGVDENGNHWRGGPPSGLDISDDGSRIVCQFLWDACALNGDGTGVRKLTGDRRKDDTTLGRVRISADGSRIAWQTENGENSTVVIEDWNGGNRAVHRGWKCANTNSMQLPGNGSSVAVSWGARLFASDGSSWDVGDFGLAGDDPKPLNRANRMSMTADGRRACLLLDIGPGQLTMVDFSPPSIAGLPTLEACNASPRFMLRDGSTTSTVSAVSRAPDLQYVGVTMFRDGWRFNHIGWPNHPLNDRGQNGDPQAEDGTFTAGSLRLTDNPVPGLAILRYFSFTSTGHALAVDVEGIDIRQP